MVKTSKIGEKINRTNNKGEHKKVKILKKKTKEPAKPVQSKNM